MTDLIERLRRAVPVLRSWGMNSTAPLVKEAADALTAYQGRVERLEAENERLRDVLDTERYKVTLALQAVKKAIDGRRWLSEPGRGSYTYDDERYQQEFGGALDEIDAALEPMRKIAGDWSDCPTDPLRVAANRSAALSTAVDGKD